MEPKGTRTWIVDASATGQRGLMWRTDLGGAKFVTQPGGDEGKGQGFVANGSRVRGVEEYRGWVHCSNGLWLPVTDAAGLAGDKASATALPSLTKKPTQPVGRSGVGRDASGKCIPYLHPDGECGCGGTYCSEKLQPLQSEPAKKFDYSWPATQKASPALKRKSFWTWQHVALGALLAFLLALAAVQEESPDAAYARKQRVPPLYRALEPFFRG